MYNNIGKKIKTLAEIICILGIGGCFITGIVVASTAKNFLLFLLIGIVGSIGCWIGGFFTYGFGELIDTNQAIARHIGAVEPEKSTTDSIYSQDSLSPYSNTSNETSPYRIAPSAPVNAAASANAAPIAAPTQSAPVRPQRAAGANEWQCPSCGRVNQNYVGTCGCGTVKPK